MLPHRHGVARQRFWRKVTIIGTLLMAVFLMVSISVWRSLAPNPLSAISAPPAAVAASQNDDDHAIKGGNHATKVTTVKTVVGEVGEYDAPRSVREAIGNDPTEAASIISSSHLEVLFPGISARDVTMKVIASPLRHPRYRIAMIITWIGTKFPVWFSYFVQSAAASSYLFDILVFHEQCPLPPSQFVPHNVHFISLGRDGMGRLFGTKMADSLGIERSILIPLFQQLLASKAYFVTEYKPATGTIFADYLTNYTHWTYGDPDVVLGDMPAFVDMNELSYYDVVTWTFGDNWRLYLRGQFTMHRNDLRINTLWKQCSFLSTSLVKQLRYKLGHQQCVTGGRKACFNSAEGCYSWVVTRTPSLKVKFATKFFMSNKPRTTALVIDERVFHCKQSDCMLVAPHIPTDTDSWTLIERPHTPQLRGQHTLGTLYSFEIDTSGHHKCAAWIESRYQVDRIRSPCYPSCMFVVIFHWQLYELYINRYVRKRKNEKEWQSLICILLMGLGMLNHSYAKMFSNRYNLYHTSLMLSMNLYVSYVCMYVCAFLLGNAFERNGPSFISKI
jgi:hypothetical protein